MDKKFLIIVDGVADTKTDVFDQIVQALDEQGISSLVHEITEEEH